MPSALKQLKATLREHNLERRDTSKKAKSNQTVDRKGKLAQISAEFNSFDTKFIHKKHDIASTRQSSTVVGRPAASRSSATESRKKSLLPEILDRSRQGGVVDRRFGEGNPHLTPEEKALERFTAERQKLSSARGQRFNLAEEDELTHYGQSLSLDTAGLDSQEAAFELSKGPKRSIQDIADGDEDEPARKKSRTEIMNEVIAKSKAYKYERQKAKDEDDEIRMALDDELDDLRVALGQAPQRKIRKEHSTTKALSAVSAASDSESAAGDEAGFGIEDAESEDEETDEASVSTNEEFEGIASGSESAEEPTQPKSAELKITFVKPTDQGQPPVDREVLSKLLAGSAAEAQASSMANDSDEDQYDSFVRMLSFEKRVKPSDRLKTEDEKIRQAADELRQAEAARLRRMQGLESEDEAEGTHRKRKAPVGGDDLDDDFLLEGQDLADGDDTESGAFRLGESNSTNVVEEDGSNSEGTSGSEQEDLSNSAASEDDGERDDLIAADAGPQSLIAEQSHGRSNSKGTFVLDMPSNHDELVELLKRAEDVNLSTVIAGIRTLYHPRLAEDNNSKLEIFLGVLLDHVVHVMTEPSYTSLNELAPHILSLSNAYPLSAARHFMAKLNLMQKNFVRGLQAGPLQTSSRTWPGHAELAILRLVGLVWSTSDLSHPVASLAMLYMTQCLSQSRVRSKVDLSSGIFLCTLILTYEERSKRIVPEVLNFLIQALLLLAPHTIRPQSVPGYAPLLDAFRSELAPLKLTSTKPSDKAQIILLDSSAPAEAELAAVFSLVDRFAAMYASHGSYIEMFRPVSFVLENIDQLPDGLSQQVKLVQANIRRMLDLASKSRRPLRLQHFKPVPIATYAPKFDSGYRPGSHLFDADTARNEEAKMRALLKKEKKGAVRELRKDNRFIAQTRADQRAAKDAEYRSKIKSIQSGLQAERTEEKNYERTKQRLRAKDKRRSAR